MSYSKKLRRQAIKLYIDRNSGGAVGRILGISKNTCLYWIRKYAKEIGEKKVSKAKYYYYDAYSAHDEVCYVEGVNSDLGHYILPLRRKSKCFFCSIDTAKSVFKIFVLAFNNFVLAKFFHPSLKSAFYLSSLFITYLNFALPQFACTCFFSKLQV